MKSPHDSSERFSHEDWRIRVNWTYLNHIQTDILVERVQDEFGQSLVTPCSMDKQQLVQVTELKNQSSINIRYVITTSVNYTNLMLPNLCNGVV